MFAKSWLFRLPALAMAIAALTPATGAAQTSDTVSYTHLTLPTILLV